MNKHRDLFYIFLESNWHLVLKHTWRRKVLKLRVLKYLGKIFLVKESVENRTNNPRRHSTIPECLSRINISCNLFTNLLSLGWQKCPSRPLVFLIAFPRTMLFEDEFGSGVTGTGANPIFLSVEKIAKDMISFEFWRWCSNFGLVLKMQSIHWSIMYTYLQMVTFQLFVWHDNGKNFHHWSREIHKYFG